MSKRALAVPIAESTSPATTTAHSPAPSPTRSTPHRPVVFLALAIFLPAVGLVLNGNLSVQTALIRFIGALFVSWVAARLVMATAHHSTGSAASHQDAQATPSAADPAGPAGLGGPGTTDPPDDTSSGSVS
ncbi:MAG: hypothetical protein QOE58_1802 [Actinomycetota bacterium]|jgi:hypothetical protein|nr:hypothetical protein [Actinomycetota bacterium]